MSRSKSEKCSSSNSTDSFNSLRRSISNRCSYYHIQIERARRLIKQKIQALPHRQKGQSRGRQRQCPFFRRHWMEGPPPFQSGFFRVFAQAFHRPLTDRKDVQKHRSGLQPSSCQHFWERAPVRPGKPKWGLRWILLVSNRRAAGESLLEEWAQFCWGGEEVQYLWPQSFAGTEDDSWAY